VREITREQYQAGTKYTTPRRLAWHATADADDTCGQALGAAFDELYVTLVDARTCGFYPGIDDIVRRLAREGRRQAVLSNACGAYARAVVEANDVKDIMEVCYGADDVERAKPAPDGVQRIMRELGVQNGMTMAYVGDAPSDGAAAMAAGCLALGVNWGSHDLRLEENAKCFHAVFEDPAELAAALFSS
jgi:phosphoglycolate phosphatase-like HAD superfamily hydrolase